MHPDYIGGITNDKSEALFPNATVRAHKDDAVFWLDNDLAATLTEDQRPFCTIAQDAATPYIVSNRCKTFVPGDDFIPGLVSIVEAPGQTPCHTAFMVTSGGEKMLFWGDISHLPPIQLPHPGATIELDNPEMAIASRERVLAASAEEDYVIGAAHLPFPDIGRVRKDDATGYAWVSVEYAALPAVHG